MGLLKGDSVPCAGVSYNPGWRKQSSVAQLLGLSWLCLLRAGQGGPGSFLSSLPTGGCLDGPVPWAGESLEKPVEAVELGSI